MQKKKMPRLLISLKIFMHEVVGNLVNLFLNFVIESLRVPVVDRVVLNTFPDFEDQGYAIAKECNLRQIPVFLLIDRANKSQKIERFSEIVIPICRKSIRSIYLTKTSRWVIFTHGMFLSRILREGQISVNIWHGTPIKKVGFIDGRKIQDSTYLTIDPNFDIAYSGMYPPNCLHPQKLPFGLPRNQFLREAEIGDLKTKKLIWLPTYRESSTGDMRKDGAPGEFGFGVRMGELLQIDKTLRELDVILEIKFHPMSACSLPDGLTNIVIFEESDSRTLYEKLNDYDALISDYSSVILDYSYTRKSILIFSPDKSEYEISRGFTFEFQDFIDVSISNNVDSLITMIREVYKEERIEFLNNSVIEARPSTSMLFDYLLNIKMRHSW